MPRNPAVEFEAVRLEGGLLSADFLSQLAQLAVEGADADSYGVPRGLTVRDEIGRAWRIAETTWHDLQQLSPAATVRRERVMVAMLRDAFGWVTITPLEAPLEVADRAFPLSAVALDGQLPLVMAPPDHGLDEGHRRFGDGSRRRSPFGLLQEYLNAQEGALWGVATNGGQLRIVRDNASLTRPAYIEADLGRIFAEQRYADFSLLWLLLHQSRFGTAGRLAHEAPLERWRAKALEVGTAARERLREGVTRALRALGTGFLAHPHNLALRDRLTTGALDAAGYQQQLLRLVYRLIFLLVAEERELLHPEGSDPEAMARYREGYAMARLRDRATRRRAYDRHDDAWEAMRVVLRGCAAGEGRLALPGLGGLFAADQCPDMDRARLGNRHLLEAAFQLAWLAQDHAIVRVNWRDMGTEELGSVYESLLELVPVVHEGARGFGYLGDAPNAGAAGVAGEGDGTEGSTAGNARKLTGSYYTPDSLVQALLESALDPVVDQAVRQADPEKALLQLAVLDPAMGSGHFLLGAGRRMAARLAQLRVDGTPTPAAYRQALRDVVAHCLYGVDKNAMAVELARMALWLETMEPGKPLAFLDHHLVHGDGILGVQDPKVLQEGVPAEAYDALTGDDREVARALKRVNASARKVLEQERRGGQQVLALTGRGLAQSLAAVDLLPDDTLDEVAAKRDALAAARAHEDGDFRLACDAYVAAFLMRKDAGTQGVVPTTATLRDLAMGIAPPPAMRDAIEAEAAAAPFLHWPVAFAPVMARGGFDCVLGNPPWEKVTLNETEFFASKAPAIASASGAVRKRLIAELATAEVGTPDARLHEQFVEATHLSEAISNYAHGGRRFPLTGTGIVNLYALFAELVLNAIHRTGRAGLVLPSGIASDSGTAPFFTECMKGRLVSLVDFQNRERIFPAVTSLMKFCLFTLGKADTTQFAYFLTQPEQRHDRRRRFTLSCEDLRRLNPNTGNAPVFRSQADAELTAKIYQHVPVLWDETREDGNPWGLSFRQGLFNMTSDSGLFHQRPGPGLVPLYEAKMMHQFDHRWATYTEVDENSDRKVTEAEKVDPEFEVRPRYWVEQEEVERRLENLGWQQQWLIGFRKICRATDERTVITAVLPLAGAGDSLPLVFPRNSSDSLRTACLLAVMNSLPFDYVARQKLGGVNLNYFILRQLAVPAPETISEETRKVIGEHVAALTATSSSLLPYATVLVPGVKACWDSTARQRRRAELDAIVAGLYGLTRRDLVFILDPSEALGPDYPTQTFRILKHKEEATFGEFRTKRLVLEAWDRLFGSA
jgi:hypothetical protein